MSFLMVSSESLICGSSWLLWYKGLDFGALQKNLIPDPEYLQPSFLDESRDCLTRNPTNTAGFRL